LRLFSWAVHPFKADSLDPRTPAVIPVALDLPAVAFGGTALFDAERWLAGQAVLLSGFLAGLDAFWCFFVLNLPLFDVPLSRFIMRPSIAVSRPSVSQTASD